MESSLILHWPALAGALVLLGFPPWLWLSRRQKRHLADRPSAGEFNLWRGVQAWQNWVDLVRGYAGAFLLVQHSFEVPEGSGTEMQRLGWILGILLATLLIQTIGRHKSKTYFLAPVFLLWGITLVIAGPFLALYGIVASVAVASVATNLEWKLPIMAVVVGVAGYFLSGIQFLVIINAIAILFPLIVTFCGRGRMVFVMRAEKRA